MILITFSKAGRDDIVLTEDDLFDFQYEASCFSGDTFELGGINARKLYLLIDNNTQRFARGAFANCRIKLEINDVFMGYYTSELPKRRNGVIELTAYDDMVKLDVEFPTDYTFPQTFWAVYAQCVYEAGLADEVSFDNIVLNGVWNNGVISADYTDYIYANSCRKLVSGMAEWNGGYAHINDNGKLQVDKFGKEVVREYTSGELMELDYSDETVTFTKIKTSQKNKTYELGTDDGYTLVINNQYISYGLDDSAFELYFQKLYDYYKGFTLTPMTFTLADPDLELHIGDRVQVYDEEEQVTVTGNVSKIEITGNCSITVTCGGFENVSSTSNYTPTSFSQNEQTKQGAKVAEKLNSPDGNSYAVMQDTGELMIFKGGAPVMYLLNSGGTIGFQEAGSRHLHFDEHGGISLNNGIGGTCYANIGTTESQAIRIETDGIDGAFSRGVFALDYGSVLYVSPSGILLGDNTDGLSIGATSDGFKIRRGSYTLEAKPDGLYFNGKKVVLEDTT